MTHCFHDFARSCGFCRISRGSVNYFAWVIYELSDNYEEQLAGHCLDDLGMVISKIVSINSRCFINYYFEEVLKRRRGRGGREKRRRRRRRKKGRRKKKDRIVEDGKSVLFIYIFMVVFLWKLNTYC